MIDISKVDWPSTYLGRLQAVASQLGNVGAPCPVTALLQRFIGATTAEVEATLAALVLFGRVKKAGDLFSLVEET